MDHQRHYEMKGFAHRLVTMLAKFCIYTVLYPEGGGTLTTSIAEGYVHTVRY